MHALLASHFLAGSILSLVLPLGVAIVVLLWYWIVWGRGSEERARGPHAAEGDLAHPSRSPANPGPPPAAGDPPPA